MSFFQYLDERRAFLAMYATMMLFVTLMMLLNANRSYDAEDIFYTLAGCTVIAAVYLFAGYYRSRSHSRFMRKLIESETDEPVAALPKPQNTEQKLYTELIKKVYRDKEADVQKLQDDQDDYRNFIMSWIHEVKLPITAGYMLMRNSAGKPTDEWIDKLEDEWNKIDHYVEQALYYSRIDSFSKDYLINEVSLNRIVRASVKKYSKLFIQKRIRFTMWNEEQERWVHSDGKWLAYILDQIVANALKYTDVGGAITFSYDEDTREKRLLIRDTGIGIKQEDIGRVFDKGFTGSNGRAANVRSTGMGLYLANQLALKLGARLSVRSKEGEYAEFAIHFPKGDGYLTL